MEGDYDMREMKSKASNVVDWLQRSANLYPDKVAFDDGTRSVTFAQLYKQSCAVATRLAREGAVREHVAILLPRSVGQVISMMGVACAGGCYVVLDDGSPADRLVSIIKTFKPAVLITCDRTAEMGETLLPGRCIRLKDACNEAPNDSLLADIHLAAKPSDLLYVLFTSGSTGTPKGVMVTHANVLAYVSWFSTCFAIGPDTVFGSQTPLYFSMSVSDVFSTICCGATLFLIPRMLFAFPVRLISWLNERKVNTLYWVPTALGIISRWDVLSVAPLKSIANVMFAGEVMPTPTLNYWMDHLPAAHFANLFGPTETTDICAYYKVTHRLADGEPLPIGHACEGCRTAIVREDGSLAAPGEEGELYVAGPFVAAGYLNDAARTRASFVQDPFDASDPRPVYRTGDIVRLGEDHEMRYVSRKDTQIKRSGYRIELGEVEAAATACAGVASCAAVFEATKNQIVLFCTGRGFDSEALTSALRARLPKYMMPDRIETLRSLPVNRNGKTDRRALLAVCSVKA
jgi:amino acid adenylation domain-containing protein